MVSVGQKLAEARLKKRLTLEEVSKAIKIKASFLSAIEKTEYNKLPSVAYVSGFVRNYAEFLGLEPRETLALFRREFDAKKEFKVLPEGFNKEEYSTNKSQFKDSMVIIALLFLFLFTYIVFQFRYSIINPPLEVTAPYENQVLNSQNITVKGKTDSNATVYINNIVVPVDPNGGFEKKLDLFLGKTTIKVRAVNKFNKETVVEKNIEVRVDNKIY